MCNFLGCDKGIVDMLQNVLTMKCTLKYLGIKSTVSTIYFQMIHQKKKKICTHIQIKQIWQNVNFSNLGGRNMCSLYYFNCVRFEIFQNKK